jgi:hypothetical protein
MNSPKEKAEELFDKFNEYSKDNTADFDKYFDQEWAIRISKYSAKQCALISVDEILNIDNIKPYILHKEIIQFYQEVKQEIEKL